MAEGARVSRWEQTDLASNVDKVGQEANLNVSNSSFRDRYGAGAAIRKGNRVVVLILGILTVVSIPLAGVIRSWPGALGAVAGMVIMWLVAAIGIGANCFVLRNPLRTTGVVFAAYLMKLVIVILAVAVLRPLPQIDNTVIFLVLIAGILLTTIGETHEVSKTNKLIIEKL
ncbi:hypothetical protein [Varibaculum vaginae]|uniref:hypothetical protein n=1 Tax=Varibaculum vaginae TaxID=2364797 RepID=UPI000F09076C|nr:hypothetical protein [Varibaculum vaginae]